MRSLIKLILGIVVIVSVSCSSRKAYTTNGKGGYGPNASYYYRHHHPAYHPDQVERSTYSRNKIYSNQIERDRRDNY